MKMRLVLLVALAALAIPMGTAQAGVYVGIGVPGPYYRPYYRPYRPIFPVVVAPAPYVYVAPRPVVVVPPPAPVYVQPAPTVIQTAPVPPAAPAPYPN